MLIVSESWFPANKSAEIGKIYLEVMKKYPDDRSISKVIARSINTEKEGIHTLVISAVKPGKVKEAMDITTNRLLMLSSIEGYQFQIYVAYELAEAMPLVRLQAPTE